MSSVFHVLFHNKQQQTTWESSPWPGYVFFFLSFLSFSFLLIVYLGTCLSMSHNSSPVLLIWTLGSLLVKLRCWPHFRTLKLSSASSSPYARSVFGHPSSPGGFKASPGDVQKGHRIKQTPKLHHREFNESHLVSKADPLTCMRYGYRLFQHPTAPRSKKLRHGMTWMDSLASLQSNPQKTHPTYLPDPLLL